MNYLSCGARMPCRVNLAGSYQLPLFPISYIYSNILSKKSRSTEQSLMGRKLVSSALVDQLTVYGLQVEGEQGGLGDYYPS